MAAEFIVKQFYSIGGVSSVVTGIVESGEVIEGSIGITAKGKKFTVVKIERDGLKLHKACNKDKVNLSVKHLDRSDIRMEEIFHF